VVLATRNPGKVREIREICAGWPVQWVGEGTEPPEVEETGQTYLENAVAKARAAAEAFGEPALADDSGIEVDALGGAPGVRSARFAGEEAQDRDNLSLLIERIRWVDDAERTARYRCVAVCAFPDGGEVWAEGV
jgi:XTP/dITP diphosphohydrolase